jgi:hypothetical protein
MSLQITEEQISKWPPDAQAVVRLLMAEVAELKRRLAEYEGPEDTAKLLPAAEQPAPACGAANATEVEAEAGRAAGASKVRSGLDSDGRLRREENA